MFMVVNNQFEIREVSQKVPEIIVNEDGSTKKKELGVVKEHSLEVMIHEKLAVRLVCTPANLVELVVGRLITEGYIENKEEIESIFICSQGNRTRVFLKDMIDLQQSMEKEPTCCTGNQVFLKKKNDRELEKLKPAVWKSEWIFELANVFASGSMIHKATQGTHSCYLSIGGKVVYASEDIGRHNAMDKVIGYAALHDLDPAECILYTTGRIPTDMVRKAVAARIPVLVSKAVPTDAAIEMAAHYGLTLICKAWPDRYEIVNLPGQF